MNAPSFARSTLRVVLILLACLVAPIGAAQIIQQQAGNNTMQTLGLWTSTAGGQQAAAPYVRIAQLDIDPQRLAEFKAVLQESVSTSVRLEPGVFTLYAVELKETPHRFLVFEMYKDEATYNAHRETPHFRRFIESTQKMVTSRTFLDVDPIVLGAKAYWEHSDR
ncbi:antibiotic biosynthesis monooxygenase [Ralstonia solanacearum]|uniref:putative quinol monooxygenase n=1 Tax=Ralstonia solanacearum TaxID=305 RepID=UPI001E3BFBB4|nr:putative quinol monooxygenase [Ralstonia solanacearum]MDB0543400.1 antibiotic biosynthesis monooxygenase [Ralstonia solanacearum]MDB0550884.1 antibiotic biosynthesis monooxygenase [Ralstonia solanacearum]MDB0558364.1 antibiotic biosynthesis monooxygenase [Ralstonia solanacearum]